MQKILILILLLFPIVSITGCKDTSKYISDNEISLHNIILISTTQPPITNELNIHQGQSAKKNGQSNESLTIDHFAEIGTIEFVSKSFLMMITIQAISLIFSIIIIVKEEVELGDFLKNYWKWDHVFGNLLRLSLWASLFFSFFYLRNLSSSIHDVILINSHSSNPILTNILIVIIIVLLIYSINKAIMSIQNTWKICTALTQLRWFKYTISSAGFFLELFYLVGGCTGL